jgi:hypothetical protein
MPKSKSATAVETARAAIKSKGVSKTNQPIVFAECHDMPNAVAPRRAGRPRVQAPADLRDTMPEHGDEAYYAAQAALRAEDTKPINATVPPSDYHRGGPKLNPDELRRITESYTEKFGPILSLAEAAQITKLSKQTLRRYVCEGKFAASVFRGRPLRFITQRLLEEVLS